MNNYEKNYESLRLWLADLELNASASYERLGLDPPRDSQLHIELLRRQYAIDTTGVWDLGGDGHEDINCRSVLIYYVTQGGACEPAYRFQQLHGFAQGLLHDSSTFARSSAAQLGDSYASVESFTQAMTALGATPVPAGRAQGGADQTWRLLVLPKIPFEFRYYHADEEFPSTINIFIDKNALTFLPFETLAVLTGCIRKELEHRSVLCRGEL
ncbi:MAG: DUF3786 domain-containing protein [Coriobacteriales bacterium]|jgi:hypothetical protein|nr:DUF3786 domain-containing protein [Coriobacteriales bacterium]